MMSDQELLEEHRRTREQVRAYLDCVTDDGRKSLPPEARPLAEMYGFLKDGESES